MSVSIVKDSWLEYSRSKSCLKNCHCASPLNLWSPRAGCREYSSWILNCCNFHLEHKDQTNHRDFCVEGTQKWRDFTVQGNISQSEVWGWSQAAQMSRADVVISMVSHEQPYLSTLFWCSPARTCCVSLENESQCLYLKMSVNHSFENHILAKDRNTHQRS